MKYIILSLLLMVPLLVAVAQEKKTKVPPKKVKEKVIVETKKGENKDVRLNAIEIKVVVPVPRIKFNMERLDFDASLDPRRFGNLDYEINENSNSMLYENKYNDRPIKINSNTLSSKSR